ncbi:MAG: peptide chain release factor N(5)-glutamine methyltransferase [Agromyces sp.]
MTTLADWVHSAAAEFEAAGILNGSVDAEWLAAHVLGLTRGEVQVAALVGRDVTPSECAALDELRHRRSSREPLQHLTGLAPFRQLELAVGHGVFVPRPETEGVVQFAIDELRAVPSHEPRAVDLGSGSGAIALAIANEVPTALVWAVEKSELARAWTERNIERYGDGRVTLVAGDMVDCLPELNGLIDVVISNPPYIPDDAIPRDPEVAQYDPELALYGGPDGLDLVRGLQITANRLLRPGGLLVIEHGEHQAADIAEILRNAGWRSIAHHRDLTGRDRSTTALR